MHRYVIGMDFFDALAKYPELKAASRHARGGGPGGVAASALSSTTVACRALTRLCCRASVRLSAHVGLCHAVQGLRLHLGGEQQLCGLTPDLE